MSKTEEQGLMQEIVVDIGGILKEMEAVLENHEQRLQKIEERHGQKTGLWQLKSKINQLLTRNSEPKR